MEEECRFLKASSRIFNVLSWLSLVVGLLVAVVTLVNTTDPLAPRTGTTLLAVGLGALYFFIFGTASRVIRLLLDIDSKLKS